MKILNSKKLLSLSLISVATAGLLYAETDLTADYPDVNITSTLDTPPPVGSIDDHYVSCESGTYFNPVLGSCTSIKPLSLAELQTGVWLDKVVDKSGDTSSIPLDANISGCTTITGVSSAELNITTVFKEQNGSIETETTEWAYYDETTGRLEMSFPMDDMDSMDYPTYTASAGGEMETVYITRELINDKNMTFLVREEYFDGRYEMFIDGLIENNTTATCTDISQQSNFVFENDYFNPNADMPVQISGHIALPDDINPHDIHIQAIDQNWMFLSGSQLDSVNSNEFTLGFENDREVAVQIHVNSPSQWYEFFYTPTSGLVMADWNRPLEDYMFNTAEIDGPLDLNISEYFASQVSIDGLLTFDTTDNVSIEFIDMQNGMYFGWQDMQESGTFSSMLPNAEAGSRYVMRVNKSSQDGMNWESYFVSLDENNKTKLVADNNIEWNSYTLVDGELVPVDNDMPPSVDDMTNYNIWLPDFTKTGYIEVPSTLDIPDMNISLTSDALDSQFYIVDGNVTLPEGFNGHVYIEAMDAQTGEWLSWSELDSAQQFKLKLDEPRELIVKVGLDDGYSWSGYFLNNDGNLTSDMDIHYTPVLTDWNGLALYDTGKTFDQCMADGNFWHQEPDSETGICYNDWPSNWIPDVSQTGTVTFAQDEMKRSFVIDFAGLDADTIKLEGNITLPYEAAPYYNNWDDRRAIMIEAIDADTGMWLGSTNLPERTTEDNPTYIGMYSLRLNNVDANSNIIIKAVIDASQGGEYIWESYYLETNGTSISLLPEESVQWIEKGELDEWGNPIWTPNVTPLAVDTVLDSPEDRTIDMSFDLQTVLANFEANRMAITGNIALTQAVTLGQTSNYFWNNVRVEVINTNNGDWIGSRDAQCVDTTTNTCQNLNFDIDIPHEGNYSVKVIKEIDGIWEEYYYNFGDDHDVNGTDNNADSLVNGQNIQWVEATQYPSWGGEYKNWLPDPSKTGYITLVSGQKALNIDFNTFASSRLQLAGTVDLGTDFVPGEYCTDGTDSVKKCEWTEPSNVGYNMWYGSKYARVEVIDKNTGSFVGHTDLRKRIPDTNEYEFNLDLGDKNGQKDLIVKITKESSKDGQWKFDEIFYNFGSNREFDGMDLDTEETLVNGKTVMWMYAPVVNEWDYNSWMPDASQTGFVTLTDTSLTNFYVDTSLFGQNDKKITGTVTFKEDFDISADNTFADVSAIDAATGMWIGNAPVNDDGTFELNVGEITQGNFVLQVNYSYNDYNNWQNSWWKNKYYDFGTDNAYGGGDDELLNEMDVRWEPVLGTALSGYTETSCWQDGKYWDYENTNAFCYDQPQYWSPNVNALNVTDNVDGVNIDLSVATGNTLDISISNLPINAQDAYVFIVDPLTYGGIWQNLVDGNATVAELRDGNYTVEFGYSLDGTWEYKHFFIKDNDSDLTNGVGAVPGNEVHWIEIDSSTQMWGPNPSDTTYVDLNADTNIVVTIPTITYNEVNISLAGLETQSYVSVDFRSLDNPYGRWESLQSGADTNVSASFDDVKEGDYILSFWYEGNEYTANTEDNGSITLKKDVEWVAKEQNGTVVCGGTAGWDCNWDNSYNWIWMPEVNPVVVDGNETIALSIPEMLKVSGNMSLGSEFAGDYLYVSVYNDSDWNWKEFILDANGEVNGSINVNGGDDYRIEIWVDGLGGYVFDDNGTVDTSDDRWITQMKSWDETTWMPKLTTLIDITTSKDLGNVNVASGYQTVTITVDNLDTDNGNIVEDVWVSLESDTEGYFGASNANWESYPVTYDENITLKVPASNDYKLLVFPMNHKGGFASNGNGSDDTAVDATSATLTKLGWGEVDTLTVDSAETITVTLPGADTLGDINGTVTCGTDDCSGWVDAWNETGGKGAWVDADGSFEIKGLEEGNYEVAYWSYDNKVSLRIETVTVTKDNPAQVSLIKSETSVYAISGTITGPEGVYAALIKTDGTDIELETTRHLDDSGNFNFGEIAKPIGDYTYFVVGAILTLVENEYTVAYADEQAVDSTRNISMPALGDKDYSESEPVITVSLVN